MQTRDEDLEPLVPLMALVSGSGCEGKGRGIINQGSTSSYSEKPNARDWASDPLKHIIKLYAKPETLKP